LIYPIPSGKKRGTEGSILWYHPTEKRERKGEIKDQKKMGEEEDIHSVRRERGEGRRKGTLDLVYLAIKKKKCGRGKRGKKSRSV